MRPIITPFVVLGWMALAVPGSSATTPARFATFSVPLSGEQEVNIAHRGGSTGDMKASGVSEADRRTGQSAHLLRFPPVGRL